MKSVILYAIFVFYSYQMLAQSSEALSFSQIGFVENNGQVIDQHCNANDNVRFIYSKGHFNLQLKNNGFSYELFEGESEIAFAGPATFKFEDDENPPQRQEQSGFHSHRIDVIFSGANSKAELIPSDPADVKLNFYTPNTGEPGVTGVESYSQVMYKNIYPRIDLRFSVSNNARQSLKYEWIINPGADPAVIKLKYNGANALTADKDGGFTLSTSLGTITESKIYAYQLEDHTQVKADYNIKSNTVGYQLERVTDQTVVIDPNIIWFSYFGGEADEDIFESEMSIDGNGNPLLTGNTSSAQYIASAGACQGTWAGGLTDAFVSKFKSNGKLSWSTYYGSTHKDGGHAITSDASNNIYVGGNTYSSTGIATAGSYQPVFGGDMDAFLVKFNSSGIRYWATYFGGEGFGDQINGVVCDAYGNLFFAGYTGSYTNIATPGALQDTLNGVDWNSGDVMLGEFTSSGNLVWCTYYSGPGQDRAQSISLGNGSDLYLQGTCESTIQFATSGTHQSTYGGGPEDAWIARWDTNGHLYWCSYYGGEGEEHGRGLHTDLNGNAYIVGWTNSLTGMASPGAFQDSLNLGFNGSSNNNPDAFLAKFKSDGSLEWSTYYGGKGVDRGRGLSVDEGANVLYLSGSTASHTNVSTADGIFKPEVDHTDGFVAKFNGGGTRIWGYSVGGTGDQVIFDTELDKNFLYMYMITDSVFSVPQGVYQATSKGGQEIVLLKFNIADSCFDAFEPNNSNLTAKNLVISSNPLFYGYNGVISQSSDVDWFRITIPASNLKIELTDLADDYDLYLYKANGAQLIKSSTNPGTSDESVILNGSPNKKYLVKVLHSGTSFEPNSCYRIIPQISNTPWSLKTGIESPESEDCDFQVHVYPNPCSEFLKLKISSSTHETIQMSMLDQMNRTRLTSAIHSDAGIQSMIFNVKELPAGIYFLEFKGNSGTSKQKVVIQR